MKKFVVIRKLYDRYGDGGEIISLVEATNLRTLLEEELDMDKEAIEEGKSTLDDEFIENCEMSNGDGDDFITIFDIEAEEIVFGAH